MKYFFVNDQTRYRKEHFDKGKWHNEVRKKVFIGTPSCPLTTKIHADTEGYKNT